MEKDKDAPSIIEPITDEPPPFDPDPDLITQLEREADPAMVKVRVARQGKVAVASEAAQGVSGHS
jgi:hypothetical protein